VGGWAHSPPGEAQGRVEGWYGWYRGRGGGWTVDTNRCVLTRFDANRLHSFSLDSGVGTRSIGIYCNLFETTGGSENAKRRYSSNPIDRTNKSSHFREPDQSQSNCLMGSPGFAHARPISHWGSTVAVDDFVVMRALGKGSAGKVSLVRHKHSSGLFVLKAITKRHARLANQEPQYTLTKQAALKRMAIEGKSPFVWSFGGVFTTLSTSSWSWTSILAVIWPPSWPIGIG
jgi:hypothetical protein